MDHCWKWARKCYIFNQLQKFTAEHRNVSLNFGSQSEIECQNTKFSTHFSLNWPKMVWTGQKKIHFQDNTKISIVLVRIEWTHCQNAKKFKPFWSKLVLSGLIGSKKVPFSKWRQNSNWSNSNRLNPASKYKHFQTISVRNDKKKWPENLMPKFDEDRPSTKEWKEIGWTYCENVQNFNRFGSEMTTPTGAGTFESHWSTPRSSRLRLKQITEKNWGLTQRAARNKESEMKYGRRSSSCFNTPPPPLSSSKTFFLVHFYLFSCFTSSTTCLRRHQDKEL